MTDTEKRIDIVCAGLLLAPLSPTVAAARKAMAEHVKELAFERLVSPDFADSIVATLRRGTP